MTVELTSADLDVLRNALRAYVDSLRPEPDFPESYLHELEAVRSIVDKILDCGKR